MDGWDERIRTEVAKNSKYKQTRVDDSNSFREKTMFNLMSDHKIDYIYPHM